MRIEWFEGNGAVPLQTAASGNRSQDSPERPGAAHDGISTPRSPLDLKNAVLANGSTGRAASILPMARRFQDAEHATQGSSPNDSRDDASQPPTTGKVLPASPTLHLYSSRLKKRTYRVSKVIVPYVFGALPGIRLQESGIQLDGRSGMPPVALVDYRSRRATETRRMGSPRLLRPLRGPQPRWPGRPGSCPSRGSPRSPRPR